jgi:hypothetical protein
MHPATYQFASKVVPRLFNSAASEDGCSTWDCQAPRAPLHTKGVTSRAVASSTTSAGVTLPSSLVRTHAPILNPPHASALPLCIRSLQVAVSPCCIQDLPDVISANLSPRVWTYTPAASAVHIPISSRRTTAFPKVRVGRRLATTHTLATSVRNPLSGLQSFTNVQTRGFARHPGCSYRSAFSTGQPWLLHPSVSQFVTSLCPGYANRPFWATDGKGTCTPLDPQPCRLLPHPLDYATLPGRTLGPTLYITDKGEALESGQFFKHIAGEHSICWSGLDLS